MILLGLLCCLGMRVDFLGKAMSYQHVLLPVFPAGKNGQRTVVNSRSPSLR